RYDYAFSGVKSYSYLKEKHRELLINAIERKYSGKLKDELIKRVYPEYYIEEKKPIGEPEKAKTE
ncbi:MAG: hypothetical protein KKH98_02810, partial [Spirochaetes bacterium]|nr:hypothetical protein [Spirochaetota bacterium]